MALAMLPFFQNSGLFFLANVLKNSQLPACKINRFFPSHSWVIVVSAVFEHMKKL